MAGKALIIDDNKLNLETLSILLKKEGMEVIALTTPRDLGKILQEEGSFDVVFLDLQLPNYNGLELVQGMKAYAEFNDVPFVAYTVHISEQNEARDAGFHSFIGKPLNVEGFPDQLRRILNGQPVWEISG